MKRKNSIFILLVSLCLISATYAEERIDPKDELQKFQGTWEYIYSESEGQEMVQESQPNTITFQEDKFTVNRQAEVIQAGTQRLYANITPKGVDSIIDQGEGSPSILLGIYEFKDDSLIVCFAKEGRERPKEFKTWSDSGYFKSILTRKK
jgi:uncharacterized protein (TIGR03067 family)